MDYALGCAFLMEQKLFTLEEIRKIIKEKDKFKFKEATISLDGKGLILRIPQSVRCKFGLKKGYKMRFTGQRKLNIEIIKWG